MIAALLALVGAGIGFVRWQTKSVVVTEVTCQNHKLPAAFEGFRILQISDLHNASFGAGQSAILQQIRQAKPDVIVVTGDLIARHTRHPGHALTLLAGVTPLAPVYYVPGNHEEDNAIYPSLKEQLTSLGVTVLEDRVAVLEREGQRIGLLGLMDPSFFERGADFAARIGRVKAACDTLFTVTLSHRPETFAQYVENDLDLVLAGHAHGGQIALFGLALYAPQQGLLPKYYKGIYQRQGTIMVVSRGLGTSHLPIRLFARPELVVVTLTGGQSVKSAEPGGEGPASL